MTLFTELENGGVQMFDKLMPAPSTNKPTDKQFNTHGKTGGKNADPAFQQAGTLTLVECVVHGCR